MTRARWPAQDVRCAARATAMAVAVAVALSRAVAAEPSVSLAEWRGEVLRLRSVVENDPAAALREADRIQATLPADGLASDRAAILDVRARAEFFLGAPDRAVELAREARIIAERASDAAGQVEANVIIAAASVFLARIDDSYDATTRALSLADGVDRPELVAEALFWTVAMYQRRGQLDELVSTAVQAVEAARRSQAPLALAWAHRALAGAYLLMHRPTESRDHALQMLEAARAAGSRIKEADALLGLGAAAMGLGELDESVRRSREAAALYRRVGTPFGEALSLFALADVLHRQGHLREALATLNAQEAMWKRTPNRLGLWWTLELRSELLRKLGQRDAAEADLRRAYALAAETGVSFYRSESARLLAALSADRGDFRTAYGYLAEASDMAARAAAEGASARVLELTRRYQTERTQRRLEELSRDRQAQDTRLRQQALQARWLWTIAGFGVVLLAGTGFFLVRLRRSHRLLAALNATLERRVADRTAELQAANRELEAFAHSVSHDLRAPVRQIHGFTGLLAERAAGALDGESAVFMDGISGSARRMGALIEDLLAFSRTARSELNRAPVDLGALTRDVVRELSTDAPAREIDWQIRELPVVDGARNLLRIVLVNLLSNAVKYTRTRARAQIEIGTLPGAAGEQVVFVRDNGVGFDMRYVEKLFGVFQRLHAPEAFEGTGIGLATVRRIVSRHGGRTWAEGRIGEGATFYFSLPDHRDETGHGPEAQTAAGSPAHTGTAAETRPP